MMSALFGLKSSPAMAAGLTPIPDGIARLDASFHETAVTLLASLTALGFNGSAACGIPTSRLLVGEVPPGHSACVIGTGARRFSAPYSSRNVTNEDEG
jgi:hypothetical protein